MRAHVVEDIGLYEDLLAEGLRVTVKVSPLRDTDVPLAMMGVFGFLKVNMSVSLILNKLVQIQRRQPQDDTMREA